MESDIGLGISSNYAHYCKGSPGLSLRRITKICCLIMKKRNAKDRTYLEGIVFLESKVG
jgi:hypothetical protein